MDSYMPKRNRLEESDFYQAQESSPRSHERMNMDLPTTSNISGTHMTNMNDMEVEPPSNRSQPIGQGVSRFTGSTRTVGRAALGGANRVLSKEQIRHFITSTVIPHHRSLTRAESEFSTNNETWLRNPGNFEEEEELSRQRPVAIVSPQTHNNPQNTQRETTAVPQAIPVPQRVLDFTNASQETRREARTVQQEIPETSSAVQVMPGQTIGASREGSVITGLPQETQEETCVPEIARVLNENKREVVIGSKGIRCSISLPQRTKLSVSVNCQYNVLSKNIEENDEIVDDDVNEFLKQFSLDKLNISPQEPANTRRAVDVSPWDPEYTLIPVDRYSCQELRGSERFVPCQDCFIDLNLFL
eukprot:XP_019926640.1 PREDICTED: uncharacterized protein LOC105337732 isoform X2 [Crassostrea gigas]